MDKKKELGLLLLGRAFTAAFSLLSVKLLTNLLPPAEVGQYYLINATVIYFSWVLINPVGTYYNRHYNQWRKEGSLLGSFKALNKYFAICAFLVFPTLYLVNYFFPFNITASIFILCLTAAAYTYFSSWFFTLGPTLNLFFKRFEFVSVTALGQLIGLISSVFIVSFLNKSATYWLWGILLGQIIASFLFLRIFNRDFFKKEEKLIKEKFFFNKEMVSFSLPVAASTFFIWFQTQGYRIAIEKKLSIEGLAVLGVAFALASGAASAVVGLVGQYLDPSFYEGISSHEKVERRKSWEIMWRKSLSLYLPIMLFVGALAPFWLKILTAPKYHDAYTIFKWGVFIEIMRMISNLLYLVSHSEKKTQKTIGAYFFAVLTLVLGIFLIRGYSGTEYMEIFSMVLFLSYFSGFICLCYSMRRLLDVSLDLRFITRKLLISAPFLLAILLSPLNLSLYVYLLYAALLAYLLFILKFELSRF